MMYCQRHDVHFSEKENCTLCLDDLRAGRNTCQIHGHHGEPACPRCAKELRDGQNVASRRYTCSHGVGLQDMCAKCLSEGYKKGGPKANPTPGAETARSVGATLAQRGERYGDFTDHAALAQGLMFRLQTFNKATDNDKGYTEPWRDGLNDIQRQALTVIVDKIARILSGDPNYDDNWHDIQGYAKLVEDRLPRVVKSD